MTMFRNRARPAFSLIEVGVSIIVLGMVGLVMGTTFSTIMSFTDIGADMVLARRLANRQIHLFDQYTGASRPKEPDGAPEQLESFMPALRARNGDLFPNIWALVKNPFVIDCTAPDPDRPGAVIRGAPEKNPAGAVSTLPDPHVLAQNNGWHVLANLDQSQLDETNARRLDVVVWMAPLSIEAAQVDEGRDYVRSPYRVRYAVDPRVDLYWIYQVDVLKDGVPLYSVMRFGN